MRETFFRNQENLIRNQLIQKLIIFFLSFTNLTIGSKIIIKSSKQLLGIHWENDGFLAEN